MSFRFLFYTFKDFPRILKHEKKRHFKNKNPNAENNMKEPIPNFFYLRGGQSGENKKEIRLFLF